ncbi:MAG: recombinase RecB [Propionibacteriales bacterium]|nr:recombinase RecB [Propionibacteriales bacterium]
MPRRLLSASPTRLLTFLDCPRRYRMTYLDRPPPQKGPPWAHNSLGAAVHTALANWWKLPVERRTPAAAGALLESGWLSDGFRNDAQSYAHRDRAREMVVRYVAELDPADEPVGVERVVSVMTEHAAFSGRVDRIDDRASEGLVIVDYKTGRHLLTVDDARTSLALAVYAVASARTLRRPSHRVELHHLPSGEVLAWEHTDETLARHVRRADSLSVDVVSAEAAFREGLPPDEVDKWFPPQPSRICGWCDFNRVCPEGNAAQAPFDPWSGLADEQSD